MPHIIWDWNGTLLRDVEVILATVNRLGETWGWDPLLDLEALRAAHRRSYRDSYETLLERKLTDDEWLQLTDDWHENYYELVSEAVLAEDAIQSLERVRDLGWTQSILSMLKNEPLNRYVHEHGIFDYFDAVRGRTDDAVGPKMVFLEEHLAELKDMGISRDNSIMVGDNFDDAVAAQHAGLPCVLVTTGVHAPALLTEADVPIADSLTEALAYAEKLVTPTSI